MLEFGTRIDTRLHVVLKFRVDRAYVYGGETNASSNNILAAFFFNGPGLARARAQPFFFAAPAGPGGPKLARPLPSAVIGHAHLPRFSYLQMASASDVHGKMIIVS